MSKQYRRDRKIDIFRKTLNRIEYFGQGRAALEDKVRSPARIGENLSEQPADPVILLHNDRQGPEARSGFLDEDTTLVSITFGQSSHSRSFPSATACKNGCIQAGARDMRSEERRVGKECRSR